MVTVMENTADSPGASVSGATQEKSSAAGGGTQPRSGTIAVIGAPSAVPSGRNMASVSCTSPLKPLVPVLVTVMVKVQSAPGSQAGGAVFSTVMSVPPSSQAMSNQGASSSAQLRKPKLPVAKSGPVSIQTSIERVSPGSRPLGGRLHHRSGVGVGEQIQSGPSGATPATIAPPPAPGPEIIVAASQRSIASDGVTPILVTVMMQ